MKAADKEQVRDVHVQIICGFLGAGKTTLLKNILQKQSSGTVVLVNEFGELGIDGTLISGGTNLDVVEMPSGCICCSLRANLVEAVREIMDRMKPERLIIEPSGIASPSSVILGLKGADFWNQIELAPVVGVIDMTFFIEMVRENDFSNFFLDQIANSDIILLNKADLVPPEVIEDCQKAVSAMNPSAIVIPTVYCRTELPETDANGEVVHYHFSPQFNAEAFKFPGLVDREKIESLLMSLGSKEFGEIFRAKGIIRTVDGPETFDYVHGLINFGQLQDADENKFVFIGRNLNKTKLEAAIRGAKELRFSD